MKNYSNIIAFGRNTIRTELENLQNLENFVNEDFALTVNLILDSHGRVVITGIGKSAIIAQKIVATLNSTGTPSIFMHAADAIHGDLGIIQKDDIVIAISKSGNTPEIKALAPLLRQFGNILIAMTGNMSSELALAADHILNTTIEKEACPHNLAPTTSTTAQLLMGDALAVALLQCRNFTSSDFSKYHPGGALGKRLYLTVKDIASKNEKPSVSADSGIKEVLLAISSGRLGAVAVIDKDIISGIITDGDIRRMAEKSLNFEGIKAGDIMGTNPRTIEENEMAVQAAEICRNTKISQIIVTSSGKYAGMVHIHDLNREGLMQQ
ncbi:MAG: KpsF/GutQ family sugar-phosphate isomerase [Bacteroidia bacterium]|nr:KpsF/GutQ family sugar-phosphate isomerase [Bacteroidia bacterium]